MPGHEAVGHREVRVAGGADQLGAAEHGLGGDLELVEDEVVVAGDDDDVGAGRERGVVDDAQAGVGDVVDERLGADDVGGAARSARRARTGRAAPTLSTSSSEAWKPRRQSLRTNPSGGWRTSLVRNRTDLPASRSAATASTAPGSALVADPEAAVEVEQDVVVRTEAWAERHAAALSLPAVPRLLAVLIACLALVIAGCGDSSDGEPRHATPERRDRDRGAGATSSCPRAARTSRSRRPRTSSGIKKPTEKLASPRPTSRRSRRPAGTSRSRWTPSARRSPAARSSTWPTRSSSTARRSTAIVAGLRDPGRRPGRRRLAAARATRSRRRRRATSSTRRASWRWPRPGAEPAGTSGSQFFIVTGDGAASLTPDYALLGKVTKGMDVVEKIGGIQADPNTGSPPPR